MGTQARQCQDVNGKAFHLDSGVNLLNLASAQQGCSMPFPDEHKRNPSMKFI